MSRAAPSRRPRLGSERGAVMTFVALLLPTFVLFMSFVIDVGNWFLHKRHLQLQADAAAFAAAGGYPTILSGCDNNTIKNLARQFGGVDAAWPYYNDHAVGGIQFAGQKQTGGTPLGSMHQLINSKNYYNQSQPNDDTDTGEPCTNFQVDVKMTETGLPWFFKLANVDFINAQARVSIRQVDLFAKAAPIAVNDSNPKSARVWFIDESASPPSVLATAELKKRSTSGGVTFWDNTDPSGTAAPVPVSVAAQTGARVAFGGGSSVSSNMATACASSLVVCYDLGSNNGILFVNGGQTGALQNKVPKLRSATLYTVATDSNACVDPYFHPGSACRLRVRATVDFGTGANNPTPKTGTGVGALVTGTVGGTNVSLNYNASTHDWTSSPVSVPATDPATVTLGWEERYDSPAGGGPSGQTCKDKSNNPCTGSFGTVQRTFGANDARSGPIQGATVCDSAGATCDQGSFAQGASPSLVARVGITAALGNAQSVTDPVHTLRFGNVGSQNHTIDCGPGANLRDDLQNGCQHGYTKNTGTSCPATSSTLWSQPEPWTCVVTQTGTATGQLTQGLNLRLFGDQSPSASDCTSSKRSQWDTPGDGTGSGDSDGLPDFQAGDPRILTMFITPFGSFSSSGNQVFPVIDAATFYITGYDGDPCPVPPDDSAGAGEIKGHFIKYLDSFDNGSGGSQQCDPDALAPCIPVMTR